MVTYPELAAYTDLYELIRSRVGRLSEYYVLGWSFSGPLALMVAAADSARVRGVILSASFVRPPRTGLTWLRWACVAPAVWAGQYLPLWLFMPADDAMLMVKTVTFQRIGARTIAARLRQVLGVDARGALRACQSPVLYLAASDDHLVPAQNVEEIARLHPSCAVTTITGQHFAMFTNPGESAAAIAGFIRSTERRIAGD